MTNSLVPIITEIVQRSYSTSIFPTALKMSQIRPKLKKKDLDSDSFSSYRPLANIQFLSKVIEKSVAIQVHDYLDTYNLYPSLQSAYRKHHSTETALIKVTDDILRTLDSNNEVILVLLDISAAFDTLDHNILLCRLQTYFNFTGKVLEWFTSYLSNRVQCVTIGDITSNPRTILHGVPQGSILGPLLFTLYIAPLQEVILSHNLSCIFYADDTQIYISINKHADAQDSINRLQSCINDVFAWNMKNMLKTNPDKTEILHFSSRFNKHSTALSTITLSGSTVVIKPKAKNLGVILDKTLSFNDHINDICKKVFCAIRSIGRIRKYVNEASLKKLINALVISRLDFCNSLLHGLPNYQLEKLQRLQNTAARMITGSTKNTHITPVLKKLHWLPINARIKFKLFLTTYKILHGLAPDYLNDTIKLYRPTRPLRSQNHQLLTTTPFKTNCYGARSFSNAAPRLWNTLPEYIKNSPSLSTFKTNLKTYLFD